MLSVSAASACPIWACRTRGATPKSARYYDELNRIKTTEAGGQYGLSFGYDVWANLLSQSVTSGSAPMINVSVNAQNRVTNPGFVHDAAGNLTNDGSHSYAYDAENRLKTLATCGPPTREREVFMP